MKLFVTIKSNSRKGPLVDVQDDGSYIVYIREPAIKGRANRALIELLSKYLRVPKASISIARGHTSRFKVVDVSN